MTDFCTLPAGAVTLANVSIPAWLLGEAGDLVRRDVAIRDGRIAEGGGERVDMRGAMLLPAFVDMHTHLDKGHICARANLDGTFMGALTTVATDREQRWSATDMRRRADFALRSAYAHGTRALRTHLDSIPPQHAISWPVFAELRQEWAGRIGPPHSMDLPRSPARCADDLPLRRRRLAQAAGHGLRMHLPAR